jgi:hypothetical protein
MNVLHKKFQLIAITFQLNGYPGIGIVNFPGKIVLPGKKVNKRAETYTLYQSVDSYSVSCIDGKDCLFLFSKATQ